MKAARLWLCSSVILVAFSATASHAATWYVGNNGDDAFFPPCGSDKNFPCRSIGKAISVAAPGDTIIVGPGVYGDLDASGALGDFPGEDAAAGCNCMIDVDKPLTIQSRDGAHVTILDAAGLRGRVVNIETSASGTVFGKLSKGFTLRNGAAGVGLHTDDAVQKVKVQGNIAAANTTGFIISGNGTAGNSVVATDNVARLNGVGFLLSGNTNILQSNRALSNNEGFVIDGNAHQVKQNVAIDNSFAGFEIDIQAGALTPVASFTKNAAIANADRGVEVVAASGLSSNNGAVMIKNCDFYGNGETANNCGVVVVNADPANAITVTATKNFWGAAAGIGSDPADTAGGVCTTDAGGGVTLTTSSPAATEFKIVENALK